MSPGEQIYYHGTFSARAVTALLRGDGLAPMRPEGRGRFAASEAGVCYLSPCFRQAADYAMMHGRADWPSDHDFPETDRSWVFAFDLREIGEARPEEDELGWAVLHAIKTTAGMRNSQWTMNVDFAEAFRTTPQVLEAVAEEAHSRLGGLARVRPLLDNPAAQWTSAAQTAVGRRLGRDISPVLGQILINMGISVAVPGSPLPVAAWSFDRRRLSGFMDDPSKADPEIGPWAITVVRPTGP